MVPARRLPGGLDAPGCLFTYAGFQHCGGQMPESPHKGRDHRLGPLLLSNPRGGAGGLALGRSEAAGWSHGTALGLGSVLRWGDPGVGSSSQPGASALCPTDCWVSAHRLLLAALHVSSGLSFPSRAHTIPRGRTSTRPSLGCVLSCTTAAGPGVGVPGPP